MRCLVFIMIEVGPCCIDSARLTESSKMDRRVRLAFDFLRGPPHLRAFGAYHEEPCGDPEDGMMSSEPKTLDFLKRLLLSVDLMLDFSVPQVRGYVSIFLRR